MPQYIYLNLTSSITVATSGILSILLASLIGLRPISTSKPRQPTRTNSGLKPESLSLLYTTLPFW